MVSSTLRHTTAYDRSNGNDVGFIFTAHRYTKWGQLDNGILMNISNCSRFDRE